MVSIPELTEEAAGAAAAGAAKRGVTVHFSAEDGPLIQADRTRLAQVLDNLIANAVKFSRANGLVRVDAVWDGEGWGDRRRRHRHRYPARRDRPAVRPLRPGINARTAGLPGTGLGLSIVEAIAELHGGHVTVDSALGSDRVHVSSPAEPELPESSG